MSAAIFGALKYLPASVARQALVKFNPSFGKFFSKAVSYGLDANSALDYLMDRFEGDSQKDYKNQLRQGAAQGTLRPDEAVSRSQMNNEAIPGKILKTGLAAAIGGGIGGFGEGENEAQSLTPEDQRQAALAQFNERLKKKPPSSPLSREELLSQFEQSQQSMQGKENLAQTMREITEALRRMRGNG
jgi:hypothetical protein